ncbi:MAG: hypothetical protein K6C95_01595 [Lachnospiraceae bacterium]|nr:hypothetical protein [Lachnospiraceae bacterium]
MDEEEYYRELKKERLIRIIVGVIVVAVLGFLGYRLFENTLTSMGLQAAPESFNDDPAENDENDEEVVPYGYVEAWNGEEKTGKPITLPEYEIEVEDYRIKGLAHVGRPSATQEKLSTDLFIVINDDTGERITPKLEEEGYSEDDIYPMSIQVRDNPGDWETLTVYEPVTVTITVPDELAEAAFYEKITAYAVYNRQHPDSPGALTALPVSVSEENGICYASFLVRDEYESEYALCEVR